MRWFAVHHTLATNRKWIRLPPLERGAWITLLAVAAAEEPRGSLANADTASDLLGRDGFEEPGQLVASLIASEWVDVSDDGTLTMHDFEEWQLRIRKPSARPERIKERVDRHREKAKNPPDPPERRGEESKGEVTRSNARNARNALQTPTLEPTLANEPTPILPRKGNLYEAFTQLTNLPCTKADEGRIDSLCGTFDRDVVRRAMYSDPNPVGNPEKFLGRVYHRLRGAVA